MTIRRTFIACVLLCLCTVDAHALSMLLSWPYVQNPQRQATGFVMQSCVILGGATACATFADEAMLPIAPLSYVSPLQPNEFRCWQVLALDAAGRSAPSTPPFCGGEAILSAPGTLGGRIQQQP